MHWSRKVSHVAFSGLLALMLFPAQVLAAGTADIRGEVAPSFATLQEVPQDQGVNPAQEGEEYAKGEVLVVFEDDATAEQKQAVLNQALTVNSSDGREASTTLLSEESEDCLAKIAEGATVSQAVAELQRYDAVAYAQPNYYYYLMDEGEDAELMGAASPNDTYVGSQWSLEDVNLPAAWQKVQSNKKVTIAFVDSGIDVDHPDLAANIIEATSSVNMGAEQTYLESLPDDVNGHGTHVAGIAAAVTNNGKGVAGASYNANIFSVRAFKVEEGTVKASTKDIADGIKYVASKAKTYNVKVLNLSFGLGKKISDLTKSDKLIQSAIGVADDAGILCVCAAGNVGSGAGMTEAPFECFPANDSRTLAVNNLSAEGTLWRNSNYDPGTHWLDFSAPGSSIISTTYNGSYGNKTGTSMSSPLVSGIAALCFAAKPTATSSEVASAMRSTAKDLGTAGWDSKYGYGEPDAAAAIDAMMQEEELPLKDGLYTVSTKLSSGKALDVAGGSSKSGANVQIYSTNQTAAQTFRVEYDADYGAYKLTCLGSGKVLDLSGGKCVNGQNVQQYSSNGSLAQRWVITKEKNDSYAIRSALNSNYALDVKGGSASNGANVQVYKYNDSQAQRWIFTPLKDRQTVTDGTYTIASKVGSCKVIDISGGSTSSGANVQIYRSNSSAAQSFRVKYDASVGAYELVNVKSGKALDLSNASCSNGSNVQQYSRNGTLAQRWIIRKEASGGYSIRSAINPKYVLDVAGGSSSSGTNVQVYSYNGTAAQRWTLSS